jgi:YaiO family outer membrane protein
MATANPNDHQARLWIARLHERMGNDALAEAVFRSVLLESPDNVDAMVGVGRTLLARDEIDEALEFLERADRLAPRNDEVLTALGRAHRMAGRDGDAIVFLERAYAVAPTGEHLMRLRDARLAFQHRVETRGFNEQFTGSTPDSNGGEIAVNYRLTDRLRVTGLGQVQRKFRIRDERGGGGIEWHWTPALTVHGQALIGPGNTVLPEGDYLGALEVRAPGATWRLGYRYFDFEGAWVAVVSPTVAWPATERLLLSAGYHYSVSESQILDREAGHNAHVRGAYRYRPRLWFTAGYAAGVEDWNQFSIDRIGDFRANTAAAGARFDLESLTSIAVAYEHQWRSGNVRMGRVTVSLAQRF